MMTFDLTNLAFFFSILNCFFFFTIFLNVLLFLNCAIIIIIDCNQKKYQFLIKED